MFSVLDMFTVGVGPSSSHTVAPMLAAHAFVCSLDELGVLERVSRVRVTLYGSLALTGEGHGTGRAIVAGLEGNLPDSVDTDHLMNIRDECELSESLTLMGGRRIDFDYARDIVTQVWKRLALHTNGMWFEAFDSVGGCVNEQVWYSIGGGFIRQGSVDDPVVGLHEGVETATAQIANPIAPSSTTPAFGSDVPYAFDTCGELVKLCERHTLSIAELVWANEIVHRSPLKVRSQLLDVWQVMEESVDRGCHSSNGVLPGVLGVPRRAPGIYNELRSSADLLSRNKLGPNATLGTSETAWVDLFAMAVGEENAAGGRIVTAPTNGAAGIIPAVLEYQHLVIGGAQEDGIVTFLLTAGAIGYLFKRNASISGAEVGCQGEIGSACSMAAAGLCAVLGGNVRQIENAAEIGIEHNLGLTCDPVAGLVQIPCIERNAMAANTAINAARLAMLGDGSHIVSLDQAIATMKQTGEDMMSKYKETSRGGLAVNVVEC